ncbi:phage portal protein [Burkholderia cenocepacia]
MGFLSTLKRFNPLSPRKRPAGSIGASFVGAPGGGNYIREPFMGAWQQNSNLTTRDGMLASSAVYACIDLISSDVSKLRIKYVKLVAGVWQESTAPRFTKLMRRPNHYQTRAQFIKAWVSSKLAWGNAYVLLTRNAQGVVISMDVLNPKYVIPLIAPSGDVFYQCTMSPLMVSPMEATVFPSRDIIHDRCITSWHPLIGVSPINACVASATLANAITNNSAAFFSNSARPSGFLTSPNAISQATADRLKATLDNNYSGGGAGKTLVGGDGLKYEPMTMSGSDAQTIEQLKWTAEDVARCFHVPGHKIGLDTGARAANTSALYESIYYSDCLQAYLEAIELLLDEQLGIPDDAGLRFDTSGLMRMDEAAMLTANADSVGAGIMTPNEARARQGLAPKEGGDTPYMQQQNYALSALAKRDKENPLAPSNQGGSDTSQNPDAEEPSPDEEEEDTANE